MPNLRNTVLEMNTLGEKQGLLTVYDCAYKDIENKGIQREKVREGGEMVL